MKIQMLEGSLTPAKLIKLLKKLPPDLPLVVYEHEMGDLGARE